MKRILPFIFSPLCAFAQNPLVPVLNALIPDVENSEDEVQRRLVLSEHFGTAEINDNAVRLTAEWEYLDGSPGTTHFDFLLFSSSSIQKDAINRSSYRSNERERLNTLF